MTLWILVGVFLVVFVISVVLGYALCVVSARGDRKTAELFNEWEDTENARVRRRNDREERS